MVAFEQAEEGREAYGVLMTLEDLIGEVSWEGLSFAASRESRTAMIEGALYLRTCPDCGHKMTFRPDGKRAKTCERCRAYLADDWEGREFWRRMLGPVWPRVVVVLKREGLVHDVIEKNKRLDIERDTG